MDDETFRKAIEAAERDHRLRRLVDLCVDKLKIMTPPELEAMRHEQRESWARGEAELAKDERRPLFGGLWPLGQRVRKVRGSSWQGRVVGYYRTTLTPEGYCVESEREPGSVQIYPRAALEAVDE